MTRQPLVSRYLILKGKLQKEIEEIDEGLKNPYQLHESDLKRLKSIFVEVLRLLEDTYMGEDDDLT